MIYTRKQTALWYGKSLLDLCRKWSLRNVETLDVSSGFIALVGIWYTDPMQDSPYRMFDFSVFVCLDSNYMVIPIPVIQCSQELKEMRTHNLVARINVKSVTLTCLQLWTLKYSCGLRIGALEIDGQHYYEWDSQHYLVLNGIVNLDCFTCSHERWELFFKQQSWLTLPRAGRGT